MRACLPGPAVSPGWRGLRHDKNVKFGRRTLAPSHENLLENRSTDSGQGCRQGRAFRQHADNTGEIAVKPVFAPGQTARGDHDRRCAAGKTIRTRGPAKPS